ncbi:hypothetical protein C8U37_10955 [Trichococcus patagoniensis]|uniref:Cyclophilin-like domain-containing protein n=1 Tax=Trichococcus patagoniensis TaxID=382641 RepID=A0A2T5IKD6_9LACT|nr:cyclophilin-like fold protein [Trichococcus patagoniensis]PTQ84288.1 hypothetical protein C8U37_10955 [Trichococcus patagoniensis]
MKKCLFGVAIFSCLLTGCSIGGNETVRSSIYSSNSIELNSDFSSLETEKSSFSDSDIDESVQSSDFSIENGIQDTNAITITIGNEIFEGILNDNLSAQEFKNLLPLTMTMTELNGNEKYYNLPENLSKSSENVDTINTGDLMLYGLNTLVLFYEDFATSYSYTPIGSFDDPNRLRNALGNGNIEVMLQLSE